jgi:hypothetical protein
MGWSPDHRLQQWGRRSHFLSDFTLALFVTYADGLPVPQFAMLEAK